MYNIEEDRNIVGKIRKLGASQACLLDKIIDRGIDNRKGNSVNVNELH